MTLLWRGIMVSVLVLAGVHLTGCSVLFAKPKPGGKACFVEGLAATADGLVTVSAIGGGERGGSGRHGGFGRLWRLFRVCMHPAQASP